MTHDPLLKDFSALTGVVVLLGGTFDPVHNGHLRMAEVALQELPGASSVVFIPAYHNPLKSNAPVASDADRIEMLRLALADNPRLFVSSIEIDRGGVSYTFDTLSQIRAAVGPAVRLVCLLGADQLAGLHRWRNPEGIFSLATVKVLGRSGITESELSGLTADLPAQLRAALQGNFMPFTTEVSATQIRHAIGTGDSQRAAALLPPAVYEFITRTGVYAAQKHNRGA
jgi:nicotinate-nucleotide adenylyltransferase